MLCSPKHIQAECEYQNLPPFYHRIEIPKNRQRKNMFLLIGDNLTVFFSVVISIVKTLVKSNKNARNIWWCLLPTMVVTFLDVLLQCCLIFFQNDQLVYRKCFAALLVLWIISAMQIATGESLKLQKLSFCFDK